MPYISFFKDTHEIVKSCYVFFYKKGFLFNCDNEINLKNNIQLPVL